MPKTEIDYSNTIIYKITCKNSIVSDLYVGHTTNFVQRKHSHKQSCINEKNTNYKCKLYEVIRQNGGWENWKMEIINFFECKNHYEARKKEQEYFISLNATLNSIEPYAMPKPKDILIKKVNTILPSDTKKTLLKFNCKNCDYTCSKKSDYNKHLNTSKHARLINVNGQLIEKSHIFKCSMCDKEYKSNVGLWKHKKNCSNNASGKTILDESTNEIKVLSNLVLEVIKNNNELQKQNNDLQQKLFELFK
jgi:hypothetical protein